MNTTASCSFGSAHQLVPLAPGQLKSPGEPISLPRPASVLHRKPEPEAVVGARRIGVGDQVLHLRAHLVGQHVFGGLASQNARLAIGALVQERERETHVVAHRG